MTHLEQRLAAAGDLQHRAEGLATEQFLMELVKVFHSRLLVACSFQKESSVLMDLMLRVDPNTRFVTLDTGLLFPETHSTWERLEERYGIRLEVHRGIDLEQQQLLFRRRAVADGSDRVLRDPQGGATNSGAVHGRRLGVGGTTGTVGGATFDEATRLGSSKRFMEGEPASRLDRARCLALYPRA